MNKKQLFLLVLILSLAAFLRFYNLSKTFPFTGEMGDNFLDIKNAFTLNSLPLIGPPTSHPWLSFSPLFYWLFGPILYLAKFNPLAGGYFFALIGTLIILENYIVVERLYSQKVAIISSLIITFSPAFVFFTRDARFYFLTLAAFYPFWYYLAKKKFFLTGLFFGLMLSFHYSPIILILPLLVIIYKTKRQLSSTLRFSLGLIIPLIPLIVFDAKQNFTMFKNLFIWLPYRFAGFVGVYPKNNLSKEILQKDFLAFYDFLIKIFLPENSFSAILVFILLTVLFLYLLMALRKVKYEQKEKQLVIFLSLGLLALFIHGNPPYHYFLPLLPLVVIITGVLIERYLDKPIIKNGLLLFMVVILVLNLRFYFSPKWFYVPEDKIYKDLVPFALQLKVAQKIVSDSEGCIFSLVREGPYDYFEEDFAQNYHYLLWWLGNEPVKGAKLKYTIVEGMNYQEHLENKNDVIYQGKDIIVIKDKL